MKKAYTTPRLTVHGVVTSLTKALMKGTADLSDGFEIV